MTNSELIAILFGAFIGYWVVSKLITKSIINSNTKRNNKEKIYDKDEIVEEQWFEILKVSPNATLDEINIAYKTLIRQYHPDKVASLGDELKSLAEEKSKSINAAYQFAIKKNIDNIYESIAIIISYWKTWESTSIWWKYDYFSNYVFVYLRLDVFFRFCWFIIYSRIWSLSRS